LPAWPQPAFQDDLSQVPAAFGLANLWREGGLPAHPH